MHAPCRMSALSACAGATPRCHLRLRPAGRRIRRRRQRRRDASSGTGCNQHGGRRTEGRAGRDAGPRASAGLWKTISPQQHRGSAGTVLRATAGRQAGSGPGRSSSRAVLQAVHGAAAGASRSPPSASASAKAWRSCLSADPQSQAFWPRPRAQNGTATACRCSPRTQGVGQPAVVTVVAPTGRRCG
jgi:hypothetical protein